MSAKAAKTTRAIVAVSAGVLGRMVTLIGLYLARMNRRVRPTLASIMADDVAPGRRAMHARLSENALTFRQRNADHGVVKLKAGSRGLALPALPLQTPVRARFRRAQHVLGGHLLDPKAQRYQVLYRQVRLSAAGPSDPPGPASPSRPLNDVRPD